MLQGRIAVCMLGKLGLIRGFRTNKNGHVIFTGICPDGSNWESRRPLVLEHELGKRRWHEAKKCVEAIHDRAQEALG